MRYTICMNENKGARFFCESCDTEVIGDAKFCPKCGRFFASVRCPACELTGEHFLFEQGCPACGYAMDGAPVALGTSQELRRSFQNRQNAKNIKNPKSKDSSYRTSGSAKRRSDDPLPVWVYIICVILLGLALKLVYDFLQ